METPITNPVDGADNKATPELITNTSINSKVKTIIIIAIVIIAIIGLIIIL